MDVAPRQQTSSSRQRGTVKVSSVFALTCILAIVLFNVFNFGGGGGGGDVIGGTEHVKPTQATVYPAEPTSSKIGNFGKSNTNVDESGWSRCRRYHEDFLEACSALLSADGSGPIIGTQFSSISSIASKNATVECAQVAFEANFQRILRLKRYELQDVLATQRTAVSSNNAQPQQQPDKRGSVFNNADVSGNESTSNYTPLIPVDRLMQSSSGGSNQGHRRAAIRAVLRGSSATQLADSVSPIHDGIHVYMVHYTPMKKRRSLMTDLLHKHGISPEWVLGFDKEDITITLSHCIAGPDTKLKPSQVSVVVKHHSALYDAVRFRRPLSLILEDDALLRHNFAERLGDLLVEVHGSIKSPSAANSNGSANNDASQTASATPGNGHFFDVMWVGGCIKMHAYRRKYQTRQISEHLFSKMEARCAHAYLVSYRGAKRLLQNFPLSRAIDFQLTDTLKKTAESRSGFETKESSVELSTVSDGHGTEPVPVVSLWVEPWLSIQGDMGGCVTNDIGAKCITVVRKYDPAFDESHLNPPTQDKSRCVVRKDSHSELSTGAEGHNEAKRTSSVTSATRSSFVDVAWKTVPKHGSS